MTFTVNNPVNISVWWMMSARRLAKVVLMVGMLVLIGCEDRNIPKDLPAEMSCNDCQTPIRTALGYEWDGVDKSKGFVIEGECVKHGKQYVYLKTLTRAGVAW